MIQSSTESPASLAIAHQGRSLTIATTATGLKTLIPFCIGHSAPLLIPQKLQVEAEQYTATG
ncbi:MAG: hypothetical protein O2890_14565, partial [Cyanobacteria bacterium]|nr:hypothetical protein [Cyanobacteriota bacterium]